MTHILAIDDDRTVLRLIEKAFEDTDLELSVFASAEQGLPLLTAGNVDVCLLDIMLPEMSGLELARKVRAIDPKLPVIFITSMDNSDTAIEAMKMGAYEFCTKPLDMAQIQDAVERAIEMRRLMQAPVSFAQTSQLEENDDQLVGRSPQMLEVYKQVGRVAAQDVPVLIRGESGTGKELIARALYQHSHRQGECFLAVNCAALSESLLESELFGHEKGAFTGADRRRIGKFEQCREGTIFLDEIGDMSPSLQSKVLRLLQEQAFERVGGNETIHTNARILSATNRDLEAMIEENEFRLDLLHRINAFEIYLPPLRERGEDIPLLINHFVQRFSKQLDKPVAGIAADALELLQNFEWPGNIRELQSVIRRAILMSTGPVIISENLIGILSAADAKVVSGGGRVPAGGSADSDPSSVSADPASGIQAFALQRIDAGSDDVYAETLEMMERALLTQVLEETEGNQSRASEILGITRGSLRHKIRSLGIVIEQVISADES